jgi:glycosyltransferase involved in cell wall biosynthesis
MRIVLGAHTVDPLAGGEAGIGWGWVAALARNPDVERVELIAHPMARVAIERALGDDDRLGSKVRPHWVLPPRDPWSPQPTDKKVWHRLLAHYWLWQRAAEDAAGRIGGAVDVAHHVTPGTLHFRSFTTSLGVPYVLGPAGGGQAQPVSETLGLARRARDVHSGLELARSVAIPTMWHRPSLRRRLRGARAVLCANLQTLEHVRPIQPRSELLIDGGITTLPPERPAGGTPQRILWVGKLEARKDPFAALDVAEKLPSVVLRMVGDGWLRERVAEEVRARRLANVELVGSLPHARLLDEFAESGVFLFTSLRDTFGVQNLEALSHGLPIVYRESEGVAVGDFAGDAAVGVPAGEDWATRAAEAVAALLADNLTWRAHSERAREAAAGLTWDAKAARAVTLYTAKA